MLGKIFITRSGYDPEKGRHIKDPHLGDMPSIGACRPDLRKKLNPGDHLFVISGRVPVPRGHSPIPQLVIGGFQVLEKLSAREAFRRFPDQRLRLRDDGQLHGNVVIDSNGAQHPLDGHRHETFRARTENYIVGHNPVALTTPGEISLGRLETVDALQEIFKKSGQRPIDIVGRFGSSLNERQIEQLQAWLRSIIKRAS